MTNRKSTTPQCSAKSKSTGQRCANYAIRGGTVCRIHGGAAKQSKAAAKRRLTTERIQKQLRRLGEPITVDPITAILDRIHAKAAEVAWYRQQIDQLTTDRDLVWGTTKTKDTSNALGGSNEIIEEATINLWLRLYHDAENQLVQFAKIALDAGVDERRVKLEERAATQLVTFANMIADRLGITDRTAYIQTVQSVLAEMTKTTDRGNELT